MREIKFRAWIEGEMVPFDLWSLDCGIIPREKQDDCISINDSPIMQYTGIHDTNNVEVYEGDIVNFKAYFDINSFTCEPCIVEWADEAAGFYPIITSQPDFNFSIEVIGNIYENPELLKDHAAQT